MGDADGTRNRNHGNNQPESLPGRNPDAEHMFRALVEHLPAIVYTAEFGADGRWTYVSRSLERLVGYSPEEWTADPELFYSRIHPDDQAGYLAAERDSQRTRRPFSAEYRLRTRFGRVVWVRDEAAVVDPDDGGPPFLQGVMYDITESKRAERSLRDSELRERQAVRQLEHLHEMKNTFLAAVSHELRTPLTSVLGISLTLQQGAATPDEEPDLLDRLVSNARKLDRLLSDLLDVDRLARGLTQAERRPTDMVALVKRVVVSAEYLGTRTVNLETEAAAINVDPAQVERIVENLLTNAAKHTPKSATIWVRVAERPEGVTIAVEDDGPGVPPELREQIFEAFRQAPSRSRHTPGTGIGLALVARLSELHGGRAWVQDRDGGGASFRVFLPHAPLDDGSVRRPSTISARAV